MTAAAEPREAAIVPLRKRRSRRRLWLVSLAFLSLALAALWAERHPFLRGAAALWIVSDQPSPADAVAVFGGGLEYRPFAAAEYYRRGLVSKILVSGIGSSRAERLGVLQSHVQANVAVLTKLGVPAAAIQTFGSDLKDTFAEAAALREWALRAGAHKVLVPTDIFAARRLRWTLRRVFGNDASILVPAIDPLDYDRTDWWQHESGVVAFQNEILKYIYYRLKY